MLEDHNTSKGRLQIRALGLWFTEHLALCLLLYQDTVITVLYSGLCGVFLCWRLIDLGYLKHSGVVVKNADFSQHFNFLIWKVSNKQWKNCLKQCLAPLVMLIIIIIIVKLKVRQINRDTRIIWRNFEQVGCNSDAEKLYSGSEGSRQDLWAPRTTLLSKVNPKILNQPDFYIFAFEE